MFDEENEGIDMTIESFVSAIEEDLFPDQDNLDDVHLTGYDEVLDRLIPFESVSRMDITTSEGETFQTVNFRTNVFKSLFVHDRHFNSRNMLSEKDKNCLSILSKVLSQLKFEDDLLTLLFQYYMSKNIDLVLTENERIALIKRMEDGNL